MPDEWSEWVKIYSQMDEAGRQQMTGLMQERLRTRTRPHRTRLAVQQLRPFWQRIRPTPVPLRLPLIHAALTFLCLSLLPARPLSIPTALGIATALIVYLQILAYRTGYRLNA